MNKIKFSHKYYKLPQFDNDSHKARLLQVLPIKDTDLSEEMIRYDTSYPDGKYELPKGDLILLIFSSLSYCSELFTTIRRFTPEKYKYYKSKQGEIFEVEINDN